MIKQPSATDRHVGARLRMQRLARKMTQERLGEALGITFQQVQKYEKGANRMPAARLQQAAEVLGVPTAWFFDGIVTDAKATGAMPQVDMLTPDAIQLLAAFHAIKDVALRKSFVELARRMAASLASTPADGTSD